MKNITELIKKVALNHPYIHVKKIINHRQKCFICNSPNTSLEITFNKWIANDKNYNPVFEPCKSTTIKINIHNYIETGDINYIKTQTFSSFKFKKLVNFIEDLTTTINTQLDCCYTSY